MTKKDLFFLFFPLLFVITSTALFAQNISEDIIGTWLINEELSDDTDDMVGDFFTKPLQHDKFIVFQNIIMNMDSKLE